MFRYTVYCIPEHFYYFCVPALLRFSLVLNEKMSQQMEITCQIRICDANNCPTKEPCSEVKRLG